MKAWAKIFVQYGLEYGFRNYQNERVIYRNEVVFNYIINIQVLMMTI